MSTASEARQFLRALTTRRLEFEFSGMPCCIENVPLSKLMTIVRNKITCSRRNSGRPWYPPQLHVEVSSACGLNCALCPAGIGVMNTPRGNMRLDTFRSLMDEVGNHAVVALLWGWGEPFSNPKLCDMIAYAREKKIVTIVSTNGQHLQTREEAERLVRSGLDNLIVSMDGAAQETYEQYRVGGDLNKVIRCLELVHEAKQSLGSDKPWVNVQTVVLKQNENELDEIERIAGRCGADMVSRMSSHMPDYCGEDADERFAPDDPRYQRFEYRDGKRVRRNINQFECRRSWNRMTVTWDGTVLSCEHDVNGTLPFGKGGNGQSFLEAWWGETASDYRRRFLDDKSAFDFCADCHYRDNTQQCMVDMIHLNR